MSLELENIGGSDIVFLSHLLSEETPGFGGKSGFKNNIVKNINTGSSCNQLEWTLSNHIGTHIDVPYHFSKLGKTIDSYQAADWMFKNVQVIDLPTSESILIDVDTWCSKINRSTDMLLIRTGFEANRDGESYWKKNPGIKATVGQWLRSERKKLRVIGFDFISLTSFDARPEGRIAHTAFLDPAMDGEPILIIEDMHLSSIDRGIEWVMVSPLRVKGSDGAPVTVIARLKGKSQ